MESDANLGSGSTLQQMRICNTAKDKALLVIKAKMHGDRHQPPTNVY